MLGQHDAGHRRQGPQRLAELEVLAFHQPIERRAALVAAEAVPGLCLGTHVERWRLLGVEGAQTAELRADALQLNRAADKLDQVDAGFDLVGDAAHGRSRAGESNTPSRAKTGRPSAALLSPREDSFG